MKRPMLAAEYDPKRLQFPLYAQPKYDGIRLLCNQGNSLSRSLKPIRNYYIQNMVSSFRMHGFDGEICAGTYQETQSFVNSQSNYTQFTYYIFDIWDSDLCFEERINLIKLPNCGNCQRTSTVLLQSLEELAEYEQQQLDLGYEGVIVRHPQSLYKEGKSVGKALMKVKRFTDTEARVIDVVPLFTNNNEATTNELGLTTRSSHQKNKEARQALGSLICEGVYTDGQKYRVKIGTGFTKEQRKTLWEQRHSLLGKIVKFKYIDHGIKDAPRSPVFLGWRNENDT